MEIKIIEYNDQHHNAFRTLNLEWLNKYNLAEDHDMMVLNDPKGTILDNGGYIWLASDGDEIVGSSALIKEHEGVYELAKMSVTPKYQGKGISKMLIEVCLNKAKELGASKLTLFSNDQLKTALHLYERYGFRHVEVVGSPFETANVKMELAL